MSEAHDKIMETETKNTNEHGEFPLWRIALRHMREMPNFGYGFVLTTDWFEREFSSNRSSNDFAFQMMALRQELENVDGYYLQSQTVGQGLVLVRLASAKSNDHVSSEMMSMVI